jgi:hypothetical protein
MNLKFHSLCGINNEGAAKLGDGISKLLNLNSLNLNLR